MRKFFMAVIAMMMTVSVPAQFYIYLSNGEVLQADSISLVAPSNPVTPTPIGDGVLRGKFSVAANRKVYFSQGNLQYQASTGIWQFAEHQYDLRGSANVNISISFIGSIDLFGWGTGNNPTYTSTNNSDYPIFFDWGINAISNGGNEANIWRTLTKDEWSYLFYNRENAAMLFGLGNVNGINGTILLPDNWTLPSGISFTPSTTQGLVDDNGQYRNNNGDNFYHNAYTIEQWMSMEENGAVFLPAAGNRKGTSVSSVGTESYYWSSTPNDERYAYALEFYAYGLSPKDGPGRFIGCSVRLVRSAE